MQRTEVIQSKPGMTLKLGLCAGACALVLALAAGCGGAPAQSASSAAEEASAAEAQETFAVTVGEDGDGMAELKVTNSLGAPITNVAFVAAGSQDEPAYLMEDGQELASGEVADVFFAPLAEGTNYDVYVMAGETVYAMHDLDLAGVQEIEVKVEGEVPYVVFERDGSALSSLAHETEYLEALAAQAEAEAQAAAEAEAAQDEYYEDTYYEDTYYEEPSTYEQPAQQEQGCVEGGVQLR